MTLQKAFIECGYLRASLSTKEKAKRRQANKIIYEKLQQLSCSNFCPGLTKANKDDAVQVIMSRLIERREKGKKPNISGKEIINFLNRSLVNYGLDVMKSASEKYRYQAKPNNPIQLEKIAQNNLCTSNVKAERISFTRKTPEEILLLKEKLQRQQEQWKRFQKSLELFFEKVLPWIAEKNYSQKRSKVSFIRNIKQLRSIAFENKTVELIISNEKGLDPTSKKFKSTRNTYDKRYSRSLKVIGEQLPFYLEKHSLSNLAQFHFELLRLNLPLRKKKISPQT